PAPTALEPEDVLAAEQRFAQPLKAGVDGNARPGREPARALHDQRATVEPVMDHVAGETRPDDDVLAVALRGELVEEEVLARDHALEPSEDAARAARLTLARRGFHVETRRHREHGADLTGHGLASVECEPSDRCCWPRQDLRLHV